MGPLVYFFLLTLSAVSLGDANGAAPKPYVTSLHETEDWALLQCEVQGAFSKPKPRWEDSDGNSLPAEEPQVTQIGSSYNIILNINVTKTGRYRCVATQEEINHQIYAETYVYIHGAARKPYVTSLHETEDWALLQCEVQGAFSKPKPRWEDSDGNILPAEEPQVIQRGSSYDVILNINVTMTGRYRCVATQEEINHQIYAETYVYIHEKLFEDKSCHGVGVFLGVWFSGFLLAALLLLGVKCIMT